MLKLVPRNAEANHSSLLLQAYKTSASRGRLALVAFFAVFAGIVFWSIPWLPSGFSHNDYDQQMSVLMFLLVLAAGTAFYAVRLRDQGRRVQQTLLTWTKLHEGLTDLRDREYFIERILVEGARARTRQSQFLVAVIQLGPDNETPDVRRLRVALDALEPTIDDLDCLASIGANEIGILASRVSQADASAFVARLQAAVAAAFEVGGRFARAGYAVFGPDGTDAIDLVALARKRMVSPGSLQDEVALEKRAHLTPAA